MSVIDRADAVRQSTQLTGIDFIYVDPNQRDLAVFFLHDRLPAGVKAALAAVKPYAIHIAAEGPTAPVAVPVLPGPAFGTIDGRDVLRLTTGLPGGFGFYSLRINVPEIDPYYNGVRFSFKANCPSELDCEAKPTPCPAETPVDFPVDYSARDFWSFRQALFDFAAKRYPDWQDRLEADLGVVLTEMLVALGDELSYAQDRIFMETALETATQRRSLRHLARLVDYDPDDGRGALVWLDVTATAVGNIQGGTVVTDARGQIAFEIGRGMRDTGLNFPVSGTSSLSPYIWDENAVCLPVGSTRLTISGHYETEFAPSPIIDPIGKWVLLATHPIDPATSERRFAVRVSRADNGTDPLLSLPITTIEWDQPTPFELDLETLELRPNLVPASSGRTLPPTSESALRFRIGPSAVPGSPDADLPRALERAGTDSSLSGKDDPGRVKFLFSLPDSDSTPLTWLEHGGVPQPELELVQTGTPDIPWPWFQSLIGERSVDGTQEAVTLEDGYYRRVFGVERFGRITELADYASSAGSTLRFGNGEFGKAPPEGALFALRYRLGNGRKMNVAPDTLTLFEVQPAFVSAVTNPLPAAGGRDPESPDSIRINAPEAFRAITYRAVRPEDYMEIVQRLPWVQRAGAVQRWTGSWPTVFVTPDPRDEYGLSGAHQAELEAVIDRVRLAGREAKVLSPRYANLDLEIHVCVAANAYRGEVKEAVLETLFGKDGLGGFFDPDHFTFGTPLSRADLLAAIQGASGVKAVEQIQVRRRGWFGWREFKEFALAVGADEVVRVANDRLLPERGAVRLIMEGGA